jgi:hypothetical protein
MLGGTRLCRAASYAAVQENSTFSGLRAPATKISSSRGCLSPPPRWGEAGGVLWGQGPIADVPLTTLTTYK